MFRVLVGRWMSRCVAGLSFQCHHAGLLLEMCDSIELAVVSLRARGGLLFGEVLSVATFIFNSKVLRRRC